MNRRATLLGVLTGVLLIGVGTMVFASGQNEGTFGPPFVAPSSGTHSVITVTGTVSVTNRIHPVLQSGSTDYELLVPPFAVYDSGVKDGQSITVKGYTVDASQVGPWLRYNDGTSGGTYFFVTAATINGKEYNPWSGVPAYGYGPRHGFGPGRGYGPGYGPGMMGWRQ